MEDQLYESDLITLPSHRKERPDRAKSIAEMAAETVLGQMQRVLPQVIQSLSGEYQADREEVDEKEYMDMRRWSLDKPAKVQEWAAQVGPTTFLQELWKATDTPKEWQEKYLEAVKWGLGNEKAIAHADINTLPPPPVEPIPFYTPEEQAAAMMIPPPQAVPEADLTPIPGEPMLAPPPMQQGLQPQMGMPQAQPPVIPPEELAAQPGEPMLMGG